MSITREERAAVLEEARKLCLEVAEREKQRIRESNRLGVGHNAPGVNQAIGALDAATLCADAIEEAK